MPRDTRGGDRDIRLPPDGDHWVLRQLLFNTRFPTETTCNKAGQGRGEFVPVDQGVLGPGHGVSDLVRLAS